MTAVQVVSTGYPLFVEARQRVDQYDGGNQWNQFGIPSEGVIVYEPVGVENPAPFPGEIDPLISLLTPTALTPGESVTADSDVTVQVTAALTGGFSVSILNPNVKVVVPDLFQDTPAAVTRELEQVGLVAHFVDAIERNSTVIRQSPTAGSLVAKGSTVSMNLTTNPPQRSR